MTVTFLDDEAIADIAYKVRASTLNELFKEAAEVIFNLQTDIELLSNDLVFVIDIQAKSAERLLHELLDEIIFLKDAELYFPKSISVEISEKDGVWYASGEFKGCTFDIEKHIQGNDIKSITWHDFSLTKIGEEWDSYILIDI